MSKKYTPYNTLKRIVNNTNTKRTLTKTVVLAQDEYNSLLQYIITNINIYTLNYTETTYNTKYNTKSKIKYFISDNKGHIRNISHVIFLLYKKFMPELKLNLKHNYIIGTLHTSSEIYARLSNYIHNTTKQYLKIHTISTYGIEE